MKHFQHGLLMGSDYDQQLSTKMSRCCYVYSKEILKGFFGESVPRSICQTVHQRWTEKETALPEDLAQETKPSPTFKKAYRETKGKEKTVNNEGWPVTLKNNQSQQ